MSSPDDNPNFIDLNDRLLGIIERNHPSEYDDAMNLFGLLAERTRPWLERIARKRAWDGVSAEDAAAEAIMKGFLIVHHQMGGSVSSDDSSVSPAETFLFERTYGLTLAQWLAALLLGPGTRTSGIMRTHNRRAQRDNHRSVSSDNDSEIVDHAISRQALEDFYAAEHASSELSASIDALPPRQAFIVKSQFGYVADYSPSGIEKLAAASGLAEAQKIGRRARRAKIERLADRLSTQQIALVLDLSVEQVRRDLKSAIKTLRLDLSGPCTARSAEAQFR